MEDLFKKCEDHLAQLDETLLSDKDGIISSCMVKGVAAFSNINKLALAARGKNMTEAKRETIATEMSRVLFYAGVLALLKEIPEEELGEDDLTELSQSLPDDYQNDTILCSMHGIQNFLDLVDGEFGPPPEDEEERTENEDLDLAALQSILACIILLADRLDLDLGIVISNAGINQKI